MYQNRTAYIEELNNFINCTKSRFNNVLKTINWTKQSLISVKEAESCQNSDENKSGGDQNEPLVQGALVEGLNNEPGGCNESQLYSDIVASLLVTDQPIKTDKKVVKGEDKAAALLQLLKIERDAKRRRISYKNKVHTKNKSHTEVLREVLEEQMLTITEGNGSDSAAASSDRLQPTLKRAHELIAVRPPHGNPHLAWLDILEEAEGDRNQSDHLTRTQKSDHKRPRRHSVDQKERFRYELDKDRKDNRKDRKRKEEESDGKHDRERRKKNDRDDIDRNSTPKNGDRYHKKKKKKRSRSHSPGPDVSYHHSHKHKHKRKKH